MAQHLVILRKLKQIDIHRVDVSLSLGPSALAPYSSRRTIILLVGRRAEVDLVLRGARRSGHAARALRDAAGRA
eukprot:2896305-Heterocapsa_arctica.AAC.1